MSKSFIDAYNLIREECIMITNNKHLKCSDCRVSYICNNTHSPCPNIWPELTNAQEWALENNTNVAELITAFDGVDGIVTTKKKKR